MKQLYIIAALLLFFTPITTKANQFSDTTQVLPFAEKMPVFPGGDSAMFAFINKNIDLQNKIIAEDITGAVYTRFTVTKAGLIKDIEIAKSLHPELDKEVTRVINLMPVWVPGEQNAQKVNVKYVLPVKFNVKGKQLSPSETPDQPEPLLFVKDPKNTENKIFITVQKQPEYPNGPQKMFDFLALRVTSQTNLYEGEAIIKMVVRKDGSLTDFNVLSSSDPSFEADVIRALRKMPKWNPAEVNGEKVDAYYNLFYRLEPKFTPNNNLLRKLRGY